MGFLIRFVIKFCFWMMLVSLFIPASPNNGSGTAQPGTLEAFTAAREALIDISGFCARQPQACETGKAALANAGERAGEVAKAGYDYLDTQLGNDKARPDATVSAAHGDHSRPASGADVDVIKAKLREMALREVLEAAVPQRQDANAVDDEAQTGTIARK